MATKAPRHQEKTEFDALIPKKGDLLSITGFIDSKVFAFFKEPDFLAPWCLGGSNSQIFLFPNGSEYGLQTLPRRSMMQAPFSSTIC
ncbi:MAG TPA: hypothetical protein VJ910_05110 [Desulfuromonadales bacterium]|nr:hypothetical protein [Desulfuromonadales bacterium]